MRPPLRVEIHNTWTGEFLWSVREGKTMSLITGKADALELQEELTRLLKVATALAEAELEDMYNAEQRG
jgi:hypothetical protein